MTDDLVKRPVLRIYTEATSGDGGLWAFSPYKSVHTVFVEESNYRDLEDHIEALTARAEAAEAERDALTAERDIAVADFAALKLAIAVKGGNEHAPTQDAYDAACRALGKHRARAEAAEAREARLRAACAPLGSAMYFMDDRASDEDVCIISAKTVKDIRAALKGEQK